MKVVGVIPARWGSTRLPGKSLVELCGRPLIAWVVERAASARNLDSLIVATDDVRIKKTVEALGVPAVMTRADHPSGTDRVYEAVTGTDADIVVNIQGDEPMIDPALIDSLVTAMLSSDCEMTTAACPIRSSEELADASVVKVVMDEKSRGLYFSRSAIPFARDVDAQSLMSEESAVDEVGAEVVYWRHVGIYAYKKPFLEKLVSELPCMLEKVEKLEQLRALYLGGRISVVRVKEAPRGVDTPDDVAYAEAQLRKEAG